MGREKQRERYTERDRDRQTEGKKAEKKRIKEEGEMERKVKMPAMKNTFPKQWELPGVCQEALLSLRDLYS